MTVNSGGNDPHQSTTRRGGVVGDAPGGSNGQKPEDAATSPAPVEPWQQAALSILLGYLAVHLLLLVCLTVYPALFEVDAEGLSGDIYYELFDLDVQKVALWVVAPLSGAVSLASLWRAEMADKRRWLFRITVAGIIFSALLFVVLIWLRHGMLLWQHERFVSFGEFKSDARRFTAGNLAVFGAALFGAIGAQLPRSAGK